MITFRDQQYMNIVKHGTYYNPASKHYGSVTTNVVCDRCQRTNLSVCIGWQQSDLCMRCMNDLDDNNNDIVQYSSQKRFMNSQVYGSNYRKIGSHRCIG